MYAVALSGATRRALGEEASENIEGEVNSAIEDIRLKIPGEVRRSLLSEVLKHRIHSEREFHRVFSHVDAKIDALRADLQRQISETQIAMHKQLAEGQASLHKEIAEARIDMQRQIAESQSTFQRDLWKHTIAMVTGTALALLIALLAK
jgi:hypothetical protein